MNGTSNKPDAPAAETPQLERLLSAIRGRLARQVWLHGLGTLLAIATAWLVFAFFADRILRVPLPVRVGHGLVLVGLLLFFGWKKLFRPLLSLPSRAGLAVLFERQHPEVRERFISAVQFQASEDDHGSPTLIRRVLEEADDLASKLGADSAKDVVDPSKPRSRFLLGSAAVLTLSLGAFLNPTEARIFLTSS